MVQNAKNFGSSLKTHFILKHKPFQVDGVVYVLKIQHMLKLFVVFKHEAS